ncbi:MAG TPA: cupin domain-containing protein [Gaiellaceae bacterium]|nr:cupin domain-containing protein [Gaiellaceae bacterium]
MHAWDLRGLEARDGLAPEVLASDDGARAIGIALAPGQELDEHQVRERAWLLVVDGRVEVETRDRGCAATAGTLVTFDPGERHAVRSAEGARLLLFLTPWPAPGHYRLDETRR